MQTHAVPQEIMSVEFKLFGNFLSLREFIFIAVSLAIGYLLFFLTQQGVLPALLSYPAILLVSGGGIVAGLVPFQERTFDKWIVAYFNAIKRPTKMIWKKTGFEPVKTKSGATVVRKDYLIAPPTTQDKVTPYEKKPQQLAQETQDVDREEQQRLDEISRQMTDTTTANNIQVTTKDTDTQTITTTPTPPPPSSPKTDATAKILPVQQQTTLQPSPKPVQTQQAVTPAQSIVITDETITNYVANAGDIPPNTNAVNIVVQNNAGQPISNVICLVQDPDGNTLRASTSDTRGYILNSADLPNNTYTITLTKPGVTFPRISWTMTGNKYPPIMVKSH